MWKSLSGPCKVWSNHLDLSFDSSLWMLLDIRSDGLGWIIAEALGGDRSSLTSLCSKGGDIWFETALEMSGQ